MNILIVQEKGRHEKNRNFRECEVISKHLQDLKIDNSIWGLNYDNFKIPFEEIVKDKDVILCLENYDSGWLPDLKKIKNKLKIFWSIDSHCALDSHLKNVKNNKFNVVLNSIDSHQIYFKNFSKTYYYPNAYPDYLIYPKSDVERKHDVGFCGSMISDRERWLEILSLNFTTKKDIFVLGDDMVNALNSYKICFNKTIADDINYRFFESLGCKTPLVTNKPPGADNIFQDEKHLIFYQNYVELVEKITYYLQNEDELMKIGNDGYELVKNNHTYRHRVNKLMEIINEQ